MATPRGTHAPSEDVVPEPEPKPRPKPKPKQAAIFALCIEIFSHNSYDAREQGCFQHRNALRPVESLLGHCHPSLYKFLMKRLTISKIFFRQPQFDTTEPDDAPGKE